MNHSGCRQSLCMASADWYQATSQANNISEGCHDARRTDIKRLRYPKSPRLLYSCQERRPYLCSGQQTPRILKLCVLAHQQYLTDRPTRRRHAWLLRNLPTFIRCQFLNEVSPLFQDGPMEVAAEIWWAEAVDESNRKVYQHRNFSRDVLGTCA